MDATLAILIVALTVALVALRRRTKLTDYEAALVELERQKRRDAVAEAMAELDSVSSAAGVEDEVLRVDEPGRVWGQRVNRHSFYRNGQLVEGNGTDTFQVSYYAKDHGGGLSMILDWDKNHRWWRRSR